MTSTATAAADHAQRGRTRITPKALNRVVSAVTAEVFGVDAGRVGVELADDAGALALVVSTSIRVVSVKQVQSDRSAVQRAGGSILDRAVGAQETIREQVTAVTGCTVGRVTVRVSSVDIQPEMRVR